MNKAQIMSEDSMVGQHSMAVSRTSMASLSTNVNVPTPSADEGIHDDRTPSKPALTL